MKSTTLRTSTIAFVLVGVMMAGMSLNAHADTSGPFTTSTPISLQLTDWSSTLVFPQFNPALGTLNSVTLNFSSSMQTTLTISNAGASASQGTAQTEETISILDPGLNLNFTNNTPQLDYLTSKFVYSNLAVNASVTSGLLTKSGSSGALIYTDSPILTEFTGAGDISLPASTITYTVLATVNGNNYASQVTVASLTGTVLYDFTPVPEPSTIGLLALACVALPFFRRKRR